ncbi:MAG: alpha/beta fold hydrolase [Limnohabitans sp.]|nr:alpha/beta fold hydrolase [Limnohabitans sp.]
MKNILALLGLFSQFFCYSQTENTISNENVKLHYKTFGKGKPILIINGGPGMNCEGFVFIAKELAKLNYKTIIYDQRGTGQSVITSLDENNITMDLMVKDIENLRKHLKIKKWTILGHSFGGIMEAYYASKHPNTIEKLIFSSSGGINLKFLDYLGTRLNNNLTKEQQDSLNYYQEKIESGDISEETSKKRAAVLANAYVFDKSKAPIIAERLTQLNRKTNSLVIQNLQKIKFDCSNSFSNFKQPVLVLQGKNDIISVETAEEIAKAFPNSKLVTIDNCAHYGWLDAKELYFKEIESFLN